MDGDAEFRCECAGVAADGEFGLPVGFGVDKECSRPFPGTAFVTRMEVMVGGGVVVVVVVAEFVGEGAAPVQRAEVGAEADDAAGVATAFLAAVVGGDGESPEVGE